MRVRVLTLPDIVRVFAGVPGLGIFVAVNCADAPLVTLLTADDGPAFDEGEVLEALYGRIFGMKALADDGRKTVVERNAGDGGLEVVSELRC